MNLINFSQSHLELNQIFKEKWRDKSLSWEEFQLTALVGKYARLYEYSSTYQSYR